MSDDKIVSVKYDPRGKFYCQGGLLSLSRTVIYAGGLEYRELNVPGLKSELGKRVHYLSTLKDGPKNAGKDVAIIGGGNSAAQCALHIAQYARSVRLVVKHGDLREKMSDYLVDRIEAAPNIEVMCGREPTLFQGFEQDVAINLKSATQVGKSAIFVDACHIFIGGKPNTGCLGDLVSKDDGGYLTHYIERGRTKTPGLFMCGDCVSGQFKSIANAVGSAREAVARVNEYLGTKNYATT
jgi:thioredoxin reductase (NADPH)